MESILSNINGFALSFPLLVLSLAARGFSPGTPVSNRLKNQHFQNPIGLMAIWLIWMMRIMLPNPSAHGRGMARDLPRRAHLITDGGYAARIPLIVPRIIVHNRRQRLANRRLRSMLMQIEHSRGFQKVYASVSSVFRHKRLFLPFVVSTCGFLSNRGKTFLRRLRQ